MVNNDEDPRWGMTYEELARGRNLEASCEWVILFKNNLNELACQISKTMRKFVSSMAEAARDINLEYLEEEKDYGRRTPTDED